MLTPDDLLTILNRIEKGKHTEADVSALRRLLSMGDRQVALQLGKFNVNIGEGKDIHVGDHIFADNVSIDSIDWENINFERHLIHLRQLFIKHIYYDTENLSQENALQRTLERYVSINLQTSIQRQEPVQGQGGRVSTDKIQIGTWTELVKFPSINLCLGDAGSGKTTLLLHIAKELADKAIANQLAPLPIYLSLGKFQGGDANTLLRMAANASGQESRVMQALWREKRQPLCFLLDGADEVSGSHRQELIEALDELLKACPTEHHTLIVTTRLGVLQEQIKKEVSTPFQELTLLSLDDERINDFLNCYSAQELMDVLNLDSHLRDVVRNPGLLTAMALSIQEIQRIGLPRNAGQIYRLLVDYHLSKKGSNLYDYWQVKRSILASLAYTILSQERNDLLIDDALYDQIAERIETVYRRYERSRKVMPHDWSAQGLVEELLQEPILTLEAASENRLSFSNRIYLEYFVAVYLENLDADSPEIQSIEQDINTERWINPLIFLIGLKKDALAFFDKIFTSQPQQATDIWLEKRPYGIATPICILDSFNDQIANFTSSRLVCLEEPLTEKLLVRLLNSKNVATRLQATGVLSQWGLTAVNALLDAAEDTHPLVKVVAQYALLHLGESAPVNGLEQPLPPLIVTEKRHFQFQCYGGCNACIGPLNLIQVPEGIKADLRVNIERIDFNPFVVDSAFKLWHTPPAWLTFSWFSAKGIVDWIAIAVRCRWIAEHSLRISQKLESRPLLTTLAAELQLRAARYDAFGRCIADAMKLPWLSLELSDQLEWIKADAEMTYQELQHLFNRINRSRILELTGREENLHVQVDQNFEKVRGSKVISLAIGNITSSNKNKFILLNYKMNLEDMAESECIGVDVEQLEGGTHSIPLYFLEGVQNIERATESTVRGLSIHNLTGNGGSLKTTLTINIERFAESRLFGIVVDNSSRFMNSAIEIST